MSDDIGENSNKLFTNRALVSLGLSLASKLTRKLSTVDVEVTVDGNTFYSLTVLGKKEL